MSNYLIYRHGSNAANQSMTDSLAIDIVSAKNQDEAKQIAANNHTVYSNQFLSAVPESKAKKSDWNYVVEMRSSAIQGND